MAIFPSHSLAKEKIDSFKLSLTYYAELLIGNEVIIKEGDITVIR
ncbi:MAG: hypothetical protein ACJATI_000341 [Halioglobus sp.]|jgi:hypothetical protein